MEQGEVDGNKNDDAVNRTEEADNKNGDAVNRTEEADNKNGDAVNRTEEADNKNDDAVNRTEEADNKNGDAVNRTEEADNKNGDAVNRTEEADDKDDDFVVERCGIGPFRPSMMQMCSTIPCFVGCYSIVGLISQSLITYLSSQIPSIEKQFGLTSAFSGILMSFNDIGYLSVCLFVSSLAPYVNIPRMLFAAFILYGLSGIMCGMPHFVSLASGTLPSLEEDITTANVSSSRRKIFPLCDITTGNHSNVGVCATGSGNKDGDQLNADEYVRNMFLAIFGIGMILQGIAKSLRGPFVTVYIDDNGEKRKTGFYIGIIIALAIAGPSLAFVLGGVVSNIYVTLEDVDFTPRDPRWIGAWWIGFIVFGGAAIIFAVPLAFFPRYMKKPKPIVRKGKTTKEMKTLEKLKERLTSFKRVLSNPVWLCLLISGTLHLGSIGGYVSFLSKYITTQFNIPLWQANMILATTKAAVGLGTFLGGLLTRMINLTPRRTLGLMLAIYTSYVLVFLGTIFLGRDQPAFVGPEKYHPGQTVNTSVCMSGCGCDQDDFFPVCGSNGINYHTPCYAGCPNKPSKGQIFTNCSCIADGLATSGECPTHTPVIYPFAVLCVLAGLINGLLIAPGFIAKIRCVQDRDKATALGIMAFSSSILGWMPTPIITGKIIDTTCIIWQNTCSSVGACLFYSLWGFRIKVHLAMLCYKFLSLSLLIVAFYHLRKLTDWPQNVASPPGVGEGDDPPVEMKTLLNGEAKEEKIPA